MIKSTLVCLGLTTFMVSIPSEKKYQHHERRRLNSSRLTNETPREKIKYKKIKRVSMNDIVEQQETSSSSQEDSKK